MKTENYNPCPFCNTQPKRHPNLSGAGFVGAPEDDLIFMVACATETCPIEGMYMGDGTWNSHSKSKEIMTEWGVKTQDPGKLEEYEERIKKYFAKYQ